MTRPTALRTSFLCTAVAIATVVAACAPDTATSPLRVVDSGFRATIDPPTPFPDFGAVKVCNYFSVPGQSGAGTYQVTVNGVTGAPINLPNDGQCAAVWQASGDGVATIKVTQISSNCTMHLAVRQLDASGNPILVVNDGTGLNTYTATVTTANGLSNTGFSLWFQNGTGGCNPPPPPPGFCPVAPNAFFGLGTAGSYTVLGLTNGNVIISEGATSVAGDVGVGPNDGGALLKSTITGKLVLDPTAHPDIHPDLTVLGGTSVASLTGPVADALAASAFLAGLAPTQSFGNITTSRTFSSTGAVNVIQLGSVNTVKQQLTITGGASDVFVFNVAGGFNFSSSQLILSGVNASNIIWNFPGAGGDIDIFKSVTVAAGTFLGPQRNMELDVATLHGAFIAGGTIKIHSAAQVTCP